MALPVFVCAGNECGSFCERHGEFVRRGLGTVEQLEVYLF